MKFLVDAHLPRRLVYRLGNRTPDSFINELSIQEEYIVITKDADFVNSFLLHRKPYKLLLVSTGNIRNTEMEALFLANIEKIVEGFAMFDFIELDRKAVIFHT
jgi:predicted nuclease of predicted toxin-antitoxin system